MKVSKLMLNSVGKLENENNIISLRNIPNINNSFSDKSDQ